MQAHRLVAPFSAPSVISFSSPFSCFDFLDNHFLGLSPLHRCFSLARSFEAQMFIEEHIPAVGIALHENEDLASLGFVQGTHELTRLSFWSCPVPGNGLSGLTDEHLLGYAILKRDRGLWNATSFDQWHIFEAVFKKYTHPHNCLPNAGRYSVAIGDKRFTVRGVMYCQQNKLNKACAHVALRSLLSRLVPEHDVSYTILNGIAQNCHTGPDPYTPGNGLTAHQIRAILQHYTIAFKDVDYAEREVTQPDIRERYPYQKYLYSGIESGCGGLLGFSMQGPKATPVRHIIPVYGHTFNKDTWAPDADVSYFNIGANVGYIPSESWTSSFLGHDDNFGPNFCIPRLYVNPENVQYAVELLHAGAVFNGMTAEALALQLLYSQTPKFNMGNAWQKRLKQHIGNQKIVLRASCVGRYAYTTHLRDAHDWNGLSENAQFVALLEKALPEILWVVEFSIPQLFPANERKLGEIILDAHCPPRNVFSPFIFARLPGNYLILTDKNMPSYERLPSKIQSHVELMRQKE